MRDLPRAWPVDDSEATRSLVEKLLSVPDYPWAGNAWDDIESCRPPIHELVERSHGLAFLRWLLQRILPYPCFLWETHRLAARLRIRHASLVAALEAGLREVLEPVRYKGQLAEFLGPRWWRSGVEGLLWEITKGNPFDPARVRSLLAERAKVPLEASRSEQPLVCVDQDYQPLPEDYNQSEAVRIQPDDWPPYAEQAWTTIALARAESRLGALVLDADRDRLAA